MGIIGATIIVLPLLAGLANTQSAWKNGLDMSKGCRSWGWSVLLYVNNFFDRGNDCIGVTWYTGDDMLYFLISPLVIYPMWSNGLIGGLAWWCLWLAGATFVPAWQSWYYDLGFDGFPIEGSDPAF